MTPEEQAAADAAAAEAAKSDDAKTDTIASTANASAVLVPEVHLSLIERIIAALKSDKEWVTSHFHSATEEAEAKL